jgi:hypothetical protein
MADTVKQLEWEQNNAEIIIKLQQPDRILNFTIDKRLINHLVNNSPKLVSLYVEMQNQKEEEYLVDFEGIKPLTTLENKLKFTVSEKNPESELEQNFTILGKYCIGRGESHFARHISENGWQHQRKYFNVYASEEVKFKTKLFEEKQKKEQDDKAAAAKKKVEEEVAKTTTTKKSKLTQCTNPACKQVIPNIPVCPYCGAKQ